jgi:hypothetical protein
MAKKDLPPAVDPYAGQPGDFIIDPGAGIRVPAKDWAAHQAARASAATPPDPAPETPATLPASARRRSGATSEAPAEEKI